MVFAVRCVDESSKSMYCDVISDMRTTHQLIYTRFARVIQPHCCMIAVVQGIHVHITYLYARHVAAEVSSRLTYDATTLVAKAFVN